jgi:hypothetical protein
MKAANCRQPRGRSLVLQFALCIFQFAVCNACLAAISMTIPNDGTYIPGQFTTVRVHFDGADPPGELTITASNDEAVPTILSIPSIPQEIDAPVLLLGRSIPELRWSYPGGSGATPLRAVEAAEKSDAFFHDILAGPKRCVVPSAYDVAEAWRPGWTRATRITLLLVGCLGGIALLGASLLRPRWAIVGGAVVVVGMILYAGVGMPERLRRTSGIVEIASDDTIQRDTCVFEHLLGDEPMELWRDFDPRRRPVFASVSPTERPAMALHFSPAGQSRWRITLSARTPAIVWIDRTVEKSADIARPTAPLHHSPLVPLVRRAYQTSDVRVVGEEAIEGTFGRVMLERTK